MSEDKKQLELQALEKMLGYLRKHPFNYTGAQFHAKLTRPQLDYMLKRHMAQFAALEDEHLDKLEENLYHFAIGDLPADSNFNPPYAKALLQARRWSPKEAGLKNQKGADRRPDPLKASIDLTKDYERTAAIPVTANPTFCAPRKNGGVQ